MRVQPEQFRIKDFDHFSLCYLDWAPDYLVVHACLVVTQASSASILTPPWAGSRQS